MARVELARGPDRLIVEDPVADLATITAAAVHLWQHTTPTNPPAFGFAAGDQPELAINTSLADTAITIDQET